MKTKLLRVIRIAFLLGIVAVALTSATKRTYSVHDKAFYANDATIDFVRPGLVVKILSAAIAQDGTITVTVSFTDPQGLGLDKDGVLTPGSISAGSPGVIADVMPKGQTQFTAYTTRSQSSSITNKSAIQASTDSGGVWTKVTDGQYTYTFKTKAPSGFDRTAVHAIGVYASRDLTAFDLGTNLSDDVYYFTPSDGKQVANPRDVIRTETCQKCHGPNMAFHGTTGRTSVAMCVLCHQPQSTDPDTGNTVDLKVMVHKIHMGSSLPSVIAGGKYQIIGFGNAVSDWSTVVFPSPINKCEVCHESTTGAANANAWYTRPSQAACGSCHDNVNFATGQNHVNLPQIDDKQCSTCHFPQGELEFDTSIMGAHVIPQESSYLTGIVWSINKVDNGSAGKAPTVTFTIKDKNGNPLQPSDFNRLAITMAGPTADYTSFTTGYVQETLTNANSTGANGSYQHTFATVIPAASKGTFAVGLEGRRVETILQGTTVAQSVQYGATNPVFYFSVDGSAVQPRREPTDNNNCLACHYRLSLHGENRVNNIQYCQFCHNPIENDVSQRGTIGGTPQTIDFKFMIHRIHGGATLAAQYGTNYSIAAFGGNLTSFAGVRYPPSFGQSRINECFACHANGSENPSDAQLTESPVKTPQYAINPMQPTTTACFGCHDSKTMLSHALTNTTQLGESCSVCHSSGAEFAATKMHLDAVSVDPGQSKK